MISSTKITIPQCLFTDWPLRALIITRQEWMRSNFVESLKVTPEEVLQMVEMTIGQWENPLWMDTCQWWITICNFERIPNRRTEDHPQLHLKLLLGDYGCPPVHAIRWRIEHEDPAVKYFEGATGLEGIYIAVMSILATFNHFFLLVLLGLFTYLLDSSASSSTVVDLLNMNMNLDKVL